MKRTQALAAVLAVSALAGGGAVAAASSSGRGTGTTTTATATITTTTAPSTGTTGTTTTPTPPKRMHGRRPGRAFGGGFAFGFGAGLGLFDPATRTALTETLKAIETARTTASDAGKAPDDVRDAAVAAAKTRLDQAVTDGALTRAQAASVLAALTKEAGAQAAVIDAAAGVLKLTPTELAKRLAAGDRLDEIATAQGVDPNDVFSAIQKLQQGQGGAPGMLGPSFGGRGGFGFGGKGGPGMGRGFFGHHGFGGTGSGHTKGQAPAPPTQTQPSTQSGSFSPPAPTTHI